VTSVLNVLMMEFSVLAARPHSCSSADSVEGFNFEVASHSAQAFAILLLACHAC
jgi:hypothetical protein